MSQEPMETEGKVWSKDDLQRLLHAMKRSITQHHKADIYTKGQRTLNWDKVAFQPYSAQECKQKWQDISQKMRKIRTLTELIVEAEGTINNPFNGSETELPVRPSPPNAIFCRENMGKFQKKHPELSCQKLFSLANKKYMGLPPHKKAIYINKFQLAKEEYMQRKLELRSPHHKANSLNTRSPLKSCHPSSSNEKESQTSPHKEEKHSEEENGRTMEELLEPSSGPPDKPPVSAYQLFCKENWASGEGLPNQVLLCAQRWQKLTQTEKDKYKIRCNQLKSEHVKKLREYLCDYSEEQQQEILKQYGLKKPPKVTKTRKPVQQFPGEPPMPSRSGHLLFCSRQIKLLKMIPNSRERMSKVSQMWHSLSLKEKNDYKEEVDSNLREYTVKLQTWFKTLTASKQKDYRQHNHSKCKYIDTKIKVHSKKEAMAPSRTSDSEDEDLEDSSSDEEEHLIMEKIEEEEEEEEDDIVTVCV